MICDTIDEGNTDAVMLNSNLLQQKGSPISPPTPITPSYNSIYSASTSYFLFSSVDSNNLPWNWLPNNDTFITPPSNHSVNIDEKDFPSTPSPTFLAPENYSSTNESYVDNNMSMWKCASASNTSPNTSSTCTSCLNSHTQLFSSSCDQHQFCSSCSTSQSLNLLLQGVCPKCIETMSNTYNMHLATKLNDINGSNIYPLQQSSKCSSPLSTNNFSNYSAASNCYSCVRLSNIPWDISQSDVRHFFGNCRSPSVSICIQSIHIMMDRTTGKTLSDAYIEFAHISDMRRAIETRNQKPLKGRIVSVTECSQEELLSVIFPKWRGQFHGNMAVPPAFKVVKSMSTAAGGGNSGCPPFITREEINSLLVVCKNYKLHFSRKCAERPFENIISVIAKYPWHQPHLITTMHRDHVYEMLKLSIESLKIHLSKDYVQIDSTLLERLVRAGIMCPVFTERQKTTLLQTAHMDCPADIECYLFISNGSNLLTLSEIGSYSTTSASIDQSIFNLNQLNSNHRPLSPYQQQLSRNSSQLSWEEDDLTLSPSNSPISSLIREIQQHCYFDEKPVNHALSSTKSETPNILNNGIPLLLQPIANLSQPSLEYHYQQKSEQRLQQTETNFVKPVRQLSPWASSYLPKAKSTDIWRMPTIDQSNHASSKSLLAT